jgi:hypothetical protein
LSESESRTGALSNKVLNMGDKKSAAKADDEAKKQADGEDDDWEDEAEWTDGEEGEEGQSSKDRYARADSFQIGCSHSVNVYMKVKLLIVPTLVL